MAVARINLKSIDYFKFKKLVIDGVRDDYNSCSKEVKSLCDCVQTLNFRDEEFDDVCDRERFEDVCVFYKQIMLSKRIDPTDMRIKSGWWGDHKNAYSAGKLKPGVLKETLLAKTKQWTERFAGILARMSDSVMATKIDGPGLYVLKHKEHQCFQYVGRADKVFARCAEKLKAAFEGSLQEPLAALLVISMMTDWDFYFIPVHENDDERVLRILENDLILKHDSIWPHGLNFRLHIDSLLEVSEFRKSCLRHHWPPDCDTVDDKVIDLSKLRQQITNLPADKLEPEPQPLPQPKPKSTKAAKSAPPPSKAPPSPKAPAPRPPSPKAPAPRPPSPKAPPPRPPSPLELPELPPDDVDEELEELERPSSGMSSGTYVLSSSPPSDADFVDEKSPPPFIPKAKSPRPTSAGKKSNPDKAGANRSTDSRPKSASQGATGRDRPTTPRRGKPTTPRHTPKRTPANGTTERENDNPVSHDDSNEGSLDRSASATSLSSAEGKGQLSPENPTSGRKTPTSKGSKARPTSGKSRQEKSRLPVAASGPLRHQNRD